MTTVRSSRWRRLGWFAGILAGGLIALLIVATGAIKTVDFVTERRARAIVADLMGATSQETTLNVARWVATQFDQRVEQPTWYRKYGFVLSHRMMPGLLRLKRGSLALLYMDGQCNNMSWVLERLFAELGMDAIQHDWIGSRSAHSALSVKLNGGWAWVDPFYGVAFQENERLISLSRLQALVSAGAALEEHMIALNDKPTLRVYRGVDSVSHARDGSPLDVTIDLPLAAGRVVVGSLDGQWADVLSQGGRKGLTRHLHYVGPRFNRNFFFRFTADPDIAPRGFRIVYHLLDAVDPDNLPESNVPARLQANKLIYETDDPEEGIRLSYKNMRWTLTNLLRRRSWYDVDMVEFVPL